MYRSQALARYSDLIHGVSNRAHGNMAYLHGPREEVLANRVHFMLSLGIKIGDCVSMRTEHDDEVAVVSNEHKGLGMLDREQAIRSEALITTQKGLGLFFATGDCIPAVLYDPVANVLALAHLSTGSTTLKLAQKVVRKMTNLGSVPSDIVAFLGPSIKRESYIFEDFPYKNDSGWSPFLTSTNRPGKAVDVPRYNKSQLIELGVYPENIEISPIDTAQSKFFFSHRRSVLTGEPEARFGIVVMMR